MPPVRIPAPDATRKMSPAEWGHWRARVERRYRTSFWGQHYFITPRLCSTIFGDGKQWVFIQPLNTRPNYYVVRVDSLLDLDVGLPGPAPDIRDLLEIEGGILDAIEEDYGAHDDDWEDPDQPSEDDKIRPFPALDDSVGVSWGEYRPAPPRRRPRVRGAA